MMINAGALLIIASLFYSMALLILFFSKKHIDSIENKIFSVLVITNFIGLILEMTNYFSVLNMEFLPRFNQIISKFYLLYLLTWIMVFTFYIFTISSKKDETKKRTFLKKVFNIWLILYIIFAIIVLYLPLEYTNKNGSIYSYGMSANFVYLISAFCILICISCMLLNLKNIRNKKYLPLFLFIAIGSLTIIIQHNNPGLLLFTSMETFITMVMYFTIENPDVKMLNEFIKNKEHTDKVNNEKAMFLYRISQSLKRPIALILNSCDRILHEGKINEPIKEEIDDINLNAKKMNELVNNILNISDVETKDIKITNKQYNPHDLLKQLIEKIKDGIKTKDIKLITNIDESIPERLMGDSIRVKQVISTVIENAIKYTDKGFIEFSVSPIIKHEICSLMITIEDSGCGIKRDKLYHLFDDAKKFDEGKKNLITAKKIIDLNGGTITVDSDFNKGTKVTIIINQKLVETEQDKIINSLEVKKNNPKILFANNNKLDQDKMVRLFKKYNVDVDTVDINQHVLEKIRNNEKYELIILTEEMPKLNGIKTFQKLKEIDKFKIPVILLIEEKNKNLIRKYLDLGFKNVLIKPITKDDIEYINKELL